jgi:hypothetical protein
VGCVNSRGERFKIGQNADAIPEIAAGQFTHDERVRQDQGFAE